MLSDEDALELERHWESCALSSKERAMWIALDEAVEAATPPVGRKPTDSELSVLEEAKRACDAFIAALEPDLQASLLPISECRKRLRKQARQMAEKKDKKTRKAAHKEAQRSTDASNPEGDARNGQRMETNPPTVLEEMPGTASLNPLQRPALEVEHVHKLYDSIADHWSHTRYKAWPKVEGFIRQLPPWSLVADLGCGNGKNIPAVKEAKGFAIASDMSEPLVRITVETHGADGAVADCLCTNFRSGAFDAAISIAVLHHLSTEPRRVQALREAARILRPGGLFLVYCWSYEQDDEKSKSHHRFPGQDVLVPWAFRTPGIKKNRDEANDEDNAASSEGAPSKSIDVEGVVQETWQETPPVLQRYCHVYREGELVELLGQVSEFEVVDTWFDSGNWCAVSRRR